MIRKNKNIFIEKYMVYQETAWFDCHQLKNKQRVLLALTPKYLYLLMYIKDHAWHGKNIAKELTISWTYHVCHLLFPDLRKCKNSTHTVRQVLARAGCIEGDFFSWDLTTLTAGSRQHWKVIGSGWTWGTMI